LERVNIAKGAKDETVIMISSTSYTPDEDLSMLVDSLKLLSKKQKEIAKLPNFHLVVTGSGPMKK
jgi:beta-1,4-mannosyltransferase